jgi:hypothetical protein
VNEFSRVLNVGSALLFIVAIMGVLFGLMFLVFVPIEEELIGVTVSEIRAFNTNVMDQITLLYQFGGLYLLATGLSLVAISLIPYRRGEKWAWYTQLIIGGLTLIGQFIIIYISSAILPSYYLPLSIILIILWLVGIVLPVKEIFS